MARNGCKKVLIVNGHGGNDSLLPYFAQTQLDKPHDYVVYIFDERTPQHGGPERKTKIDMHAGESETSKMMISRPDSVHLDRATSESGADQARQKLPRGRLHRHLVVHALSESLFGRRFGGNERIGRIPDEVVDRFSREGDPRSEGGRCQSETAE